MNGLPRSPICSRSMGNPLLVTKMIYLDYNATAPTKAIAAEAVMAAMAHSGNPSSVHGPGREARQMVEDARAKIARAVGARAEDVIFTSGGTEANNQVLRTQVGIRRLLISAIEHDGVLAAANASGLVVEIIPVDNHGIIDLDFLTERLAADEGRALVSVMLVNNEVGTIAPVAEAVKIAHDAGALMHTDAVQAFGKIALNFADLGVDFMSLTAHKMGGPLGVGVLIHRPGIDVNPLITGGGQEMARRSGTENVPGIAGMGAAADLVGDDVDAGPRIAKLRDGLEDAILAISPDSRIYGRGAERLPNTTMVSMPGVPGDTQVMAMDLAGYAVSSGSACSSGKVKKSRILDAMGCAGKEAGEAIRVSLSPATTQDEIDGFVAAWQALFERTGANA